MNKNIQMVFIAATIIFIGCASISYGKNKNIWEEFVKTPNENTFRICQAHIAASDEKRMLEKLLFDNVHIYGQYLRLVNSGNIYALELAFQLQDIISPGVTRAELFIDMGKTIHLLPEQFLYLVDKYKPNNESLRSMLLMYGDGYVDNIGKQIEEARKRIASIARVNNKKLRPAQQLCISKLSEHEQFLIKTNKTLELSKQINQILKHDPEMAFQKMIENDLTDEMSCSGILGLDLPNDETRANKTAERIKFIEEKIKRKELLDLKRKCLKVLTREKKFFSQ